MTSPLQLPQAQIPASAGLAMPPSDFSPGSRCINAENGIIAAFYFRDDIGPEIVERVDPDWFQIPLNRALVREALRQLRNARQLDPFLAAERVQHSVGCSFTAREISDTLETAFRIKDWASSFNIQGCLSTLLRTFEQLELDGLAKEVARGVERDEDPVQIAEQCRNSLNSQSERRDRILNYPSSGIRTVADLMENHPALRPPLIDGLLREGEVMNIIAGPKCGKTHLAHYLAGAVSTGTPWLGWETAQKRVLIADAELHLETIAYRFKNLSANGLITPASACNISVLPLRGTSMTISGLMDFLRRYPRGHFGLVVIDALYRFLPQGGEENSNSMMAQVYGEVDALAITAGSAVAIVHHTTKGLQAAKSITDIGAGGGAQSRAADTHLVIRPHEDPEHFVVEATTRSFPEPEARVILWTKPGWRLVPGGDPTRLKQDRSTTRSASTATKTIKRSWSPMEFSRDIVGPNPCIESEILARASESGISKTEAKSLLKLATSEGAVVIEPGPANKPRNYKGVDHSGCVSAPKAPPPPCASAHTGGTGGTHTHTHSQRN